MGPRPDFGATIDAISARLKELEGGAAPREQPPRAEEVGQEQAQEALASAIASSAASHMGAAMDPSEAAQHMQHVQAAMAQAHVAAANAGIGMSDHKKPVESPPPVEKPQPVVEAPRTRSKAKAEIPPPKMAPSQDQVKSVAKDGPPLPGSIFPSYIPSATATSSNAGGGRSEADLRAAVAELGLSPEHLTAMAQAGLSTGDTDFPNPADMSMEDFVQQFQKSMTPSKASAFMSTFKSILEKEENDKRGGLQLLPPRKGGALQGYLEEKIAESTMEAERARARANEAGVAIHQKQWHAQKVAMAKLNCKKMQGEELTDDEQRFLQLQSLTEAINEQRLRDSLQEQNELTQKDPSICISDWGTVARKAHLIRNKKALAVKQNAILAESEEETKAPVPAFRNSFVLDGLGKPKVGVTIDHLSVESAARAAASASAYAAKVAKASNSKIPTVEESIAAFDPEAAPLEPDDPPAKNFKYGEGSDAGLSGIGGVSSMRDFGQYGSGGMRDGSPGRSGPFGIRPAGAEIGPRRFRSSGRNGSRSGGGRRKTSGRHTTSARRGCRSSPRLKERDDGDRRRGRRGRRLSRSQVLSPVFSGEGSDASPSPGIRRGKLMLQHANRLQNDSRSPSPRIQELGPPAAKRRKVSGKHKKQICRRKLLRHGSAAYSPNDELSEYEYYSEEDSYSPIRSVSRSRSQPRRQPGKNWDVVDTAAIPDLPIMIPPQSIVERKAKQAMMDKRFCMKFLTGRCGDRGCTMRHALSEADQQEAMTKFAKQCKNGLRCTDTFCLYRHDPVGAIIDHTQMTRPFVTAPAAMLALPPAS